MAAAEKYRILVVEDDPQIADLALANLNIAGLECRHAADGIQGLIEFKEFDPHIVLTDLMLPGMDGRTLCAEIRQVSLVPIILMTSADTSDAEAQAFEAGADDYIPKPFDPRLLVLRVSAHLRRVYQYDLQAAQAMNQVDSTSAPIEDAADGASLQPGWTVCEGCGYRGPTTQFRKENQYGQRYMMCPNCQGMDQLIFG